MAGRVGTNIAGQWQVAGPLAIPGLKQLFVGKSLRELHDSTVREFDTATNLLESQIRLLFEQVAVQLPRLVPIETWRGY